MQASSRRSSSVISRLASGSGVSAATSSTVESSSIDTSVFLRTWSIARLRAIATIHVIGDAMAGSNWPALFQILK